MQGFFLNVCKRFLQCACPVNTVKRLTINISEISLEQSRSVTELVQILAIPGKENGAGLQLFACAHNTGRALSSCSILQDNSDFSPNPGFTRGGKTMKSKKRQCICYSLIVLVMSLFMSAGAFSSLTAKPGHGNSHIKVMTRNLYLGADIFKVVEAAQEDPDNPLAVPYAVAEVYQTMLFTNFWARAQAIADEIAKNRPMVIGLQEVSAFYKQTPGDFLAGNPVQAGDVVIDFYEVLNEALLERGMVYDAFEVTNAAVELPMADAASPTGLSDVRMVDHDMILVWNRHDATLVLAGNYANNLELNIGGADVAFTRGYLVVDVDVRGRSFRCVNTHLEVRSSADSVFRIVQAAQMQELLGTLDWLSYSDPKPVIMTGDFNSSPDDVPGEAYHPVLGQWLPYVPPYMQAVNAGYLDTWLLQKKYDEGSTSGFDEYVSDPSAELTSRIDLIFADPKDLLIWKTRCDVVGDEVSDMIPNPADPDALMLWPSDHAGVVAEIKFFRNFFHPKFWRWRKKK